MYAMRSGTSHGFPNGTSSSGGLHFLLVEDQTLVRQLLIADIKAKYSGCRISEAGNLEELRKLDNKGLGFVSLAIVDLELPDGNALDWAEAYLARGGNPKVMVLSSISEDYILYRALRSHVSGFVHKNDGRESLVTGIDLILNGSSFFSPTVQMLRKNMHADKSFFSKILSEKELRILQLIGQGTSNEEIAEIEGSKIATIVDHRKNIMAKLDIHSAPDLVIYAVQKGISRI
jgi:two-component system, NarL family, response regulator NreC